MKKHWLFLLLLGLALVPDPLWAGEHRFGLNAGTLPFNEPTTSALLPADVELRLRYFPPGCPFSVSSPAQLPAGCPPVPNIAGAVRPPGGIMDPTGQLLNDSVHLDRPVEGVRTLFDHRRDFQASDFSGAFPEINYEWRRDVDAHFALEVAFGWYSAKSTRTAAGNAGVKGDPFDFDGDGVSGTEVVEDVPTKVNNTLEWTLYFVHVTPKYYFTTGKIRVFVGGGLGLWANLWNESLRYEYLNVFCKTDTDPSCGSQQSYKESEGERRTIVPASVSVGAQFQFLNHWAVYIESRYLFNASTNLNLFRSDSVYDFSGNQFIVGINYKL
jgi:opacity protein-like surface antigen